MPMISLFQSTATAASIRPRWIPFSGLFGIKYLLVTGCTTSVCVESTVRDAMFRDYICILLEDCMAEPVGYGLPRSNHEASLLVLQLLFAWTSNSRALLQELEKRECDQHPWSTIASPLPQVA